jgi:hypothetical protein
MSLFLWGLFADWNSTNYRFGKGLDKINSGLIETGISLATPIPTKERQEWYMKMENRIKPFVKQKITDRSKIEVILLNA